MDSVTQLKLHVKAATAFLSIHGLLFHACYSISNPESPSSIFNTKPYQLLMLSVSTTPFTTFIKTKAYHVLCLLVPIEEVKNAYLILVEFVNPYILHLKMKHLLYITIHIQVGMGYLGINFLRKEQERKNMLIRLEDQVPAELKQEQVKEHKSGNSSTNDNTSTSSNTSSTSKKNKSKGHQVKDISKTFRKSAGPFIFFVALPYMAQIIFFGGLNMFAFHCFRDDFHRTIRLNGLFDEDGTRFVATANQKTNYRSPGGTYMGGSGL
jgi:hypothetical protein